ncbi:MAG: putative metal-dependent hydrolase [Acidobacteriota bacterium]
MAADSLTEAPDPRFPIGDFVAPESISDEDRRYAIHTLAEMPELLREAVRHLDEEQINTPYREGGWAVRQVVHHVADSHSTAVFRLRKALTEDWPVVPGYDEKLFAELADVKVAPVEWSLELIESVHARWVMLLQTLDEAQWKRGFKHEERGPMTVEHATLLYAWHSRHHVAHINHLRAQKGW